jgi:fumarylacetoacetase
VALDETHDPSLESWVDAANQPDNDFPVQNLPFCVFRHGHGAPRVGVGIGDQILEVPGYTSLNGLMALGRKSCSELRLVLSRVLRSDNPNPPLDLLRPIAECSLEMPVEIGDYTDFYASIFHATNVGKIFRPNADPLPPNYKYVPIGYHGRASSVVISGTPVHRPSGQRRDGPADPAFGPSRQMDYECEVGCFIGKGNPLGEPVPIEQAEEHLFGLCLLNDWSARDIQRWESQPLGPFLSKSFATSISPWLVTLDALEPFRAPRYQAAAPFEYLDGAQDREKGGFAIALEVWLQTAKMGEPVRLSRAGFECMYWTPAQLLTHHASNGCNLRTGDLIGSGTVSGPEKDARGCMLELAWRGTEPVSLPTGESRAFLEDGDQVILRGYAQREGARRIGFGECRGQLLPAK